MARHPLAPAETGRCAQHSPGRPLPLGLILQAEAACSRSRMRPPGGTRGTCTATGMLNRNSVLVHGAIWGDTVLVEPRLPVARYFILPPRHYPFRLSPRRHRCEPSSTGECGCCEGYASYLRHNGFAVDLMPTDDLTMLSRQAGVPQSLDGCHLSVIDGYAADSPLPKIFMTAP